MQLEFIDVELSESRLYRYSDRFQQFNGKEVAKLLYLTTLTTYMLTLDDETQDYGLAYAQKTTQYSNYNLFRSHATDLYLLAYEVANPNNSNIKLDKNFISKSYLDGIRFLPRMHWRFIYNISTESVSMSDVYSNFYRLEMQLKITDSRYKRWRRLILDWRNLKHIQKQLVVAEIAQEFRRLGRGSELLTPLNKMLKDRNYVNAPASSSSGGSTLAAVAGGLIGNKVASAIGANKTLGTGIGALAAYWASGKASLK